MSGPASDIAKIDVQVTEAEPPARSKRLTRNESATALQTRMSDKFASDPSLHSAMAETLEKSVKLESKAKRWQKATLGVTFMAALLLSAMFSVVILGNEISKEMKTDATHHALVSKADPDAIVEVKAAEQILPLNLAPILDTETLSHVKTLTATLPGDMSDYLIANNNASVDDNGHSFTRSYTVTGFAKSSDIDMVFFTSAGDVVHISEGQAYVETSSGMIYDVCFASAACTSIKASGVDLEAARLRAIKALQDAGIQVTEEDRRRLMHTPQTFSSSSCHNGNKCNKNRLCKARFKNNGVCDDGGPGSEYGSCARGSDCDDCGSRG